MKGFSSLSMPTSVILETVSTSSSKKNESKLLATSSAKWDARYSHDPPHTTDYYLKCGVGGVLSCGLTHLAVILNNCIFNC
jgi:solute carrier family 25 phosphate transporter 3